VPDLEPNALLRDIFDIPEVVAAADFVLQLHSGVDHAERTAAEYVATESLAEAFDDALGYVNQALTSGRSQGIFLHGSFGSGKSHFMAILDLMLRGERAAKAIPGLQWVVAKYQPVLDRRLLTVEYHLIGATSLEDAMFSGFARRVAQIDPAGTPPMLHKSDRLFEDAAAMRQGNEADFFSRLNAGRDAGGGWGDYAEGWTPETYDRAAAAPPNDPDRTRLASDLVSTIFKGYAQAGEWLDIADGLVVMTQTAKNLGYDGLVLFLDELVLWLASHAADAAFVATEASKVAKLVEAGAGRRDVPIVSFVARQRELSDFVGDKAAGVQRAQVGQAIQYWEDRFDTITLSASNLPEVAHKRLLTPVSPEAAAQVAKAVAAVKASPSWNILLHDADEEAFAKVYPFSPALVDVLVALSGRLQRERTALKVMALLLSARRSTGRITEVIGVGDLYDVMIAEGEQPLSPEMRQLFATARRLYETKFVPALTAQHGVPSLDDLSHDHQAHKDARLAKTLLVAALVPEVESLRALTAGRLAALNHGSVVAMIAGMEAAQVLAAARGWAQQIGEIHIGEGNDPTISVELSGVDYESVLARVENEDTVGARRKLLQRLLFAEMGIPEPSQLALGGQTFDRIWRGTKRTVDVLFGNIRDSAAVPDDALVADGGRWKLVIDYPFDDADHGPQEDVNRFDQLRISAPPSRTVGWVPYFLTADRLADLGTLVQLEHLLGGGGGQFDQNAAHLAVEQRALAKQSLENLRRARTETLKAALRQAYGVDPARGGDVDAQGFGEVTLLPTLWREQPLQRPTGATLSQALDHVVDQILGLQYPQHPRFDNGTSEIRSTDLRNLWDVVVKAAASPGGRLDPVEQNRRPLVRRLAGPLRLGHVGDAHFVFDVGTFGWRNEFLRRAAADDLGSRIPVASIRDWLDPLGLTREMSNLIIAAFALLEDKQFEVRGATVDVAGPSAISDDMVLIDPHLPSEDAWETATARAAELFGLQPGQLRTAANVGTLGRQLGEAARTRLNPCRELVALLRKHQATLALQPDAERLTTANAGLAIVEGLAAAADDVSRVEALGTIPVPEEAHPLAKSMSSAGELVRGLDAHDWTTLDAVAQEADAGDESARQALAGLREAAAAEELHVRLLSRLSAAHAAATQWLLNRPVSPPPPPPPPPSPGPGPGLDVGTTPPQPPGPPPGPDDVELLIDGDRLSAELTALQRDIARAIGADRGRRVRITWRVL
jgi:hypothetical protein